MIFPYRTKLTTDCNILFLGNHIPSGKKEVIDRIQNCWETELEYDPTTKQFTKTKCNCTDYQIKSSKDETYICKHIMEDLNYLNLVL